MHDSTFFSKIQICKLLPWVEVEVKYQSKNTIVQKLNVKHVDPVSGGTCFRTHILLFMSVLP